MSKLYLTGVGAGSTDCITLGALRAIESSDMIFAPVKKTGEKSTALEIIRRAAQIPENKITELEFPMTRDREAWQRAHSAAAEKIISVMREGKTAAFITLGDVSLYSTAAYMGKIIRAEGYETEIISAVPSFIAAANAARLSLAESDESVLVIPASSIEKIGRYLNDFDTLVIMKAGRAIKELYALLKAHNLENNAVVCSDIGMSTQKVTPLTQDGSYGYFTTVIIKIVDNNSVK